MDSSGLAAVTVLTFIPELIALGKAALATVAILVDGAVVEEIVESKEDCETQSQTITATCAGKCDNNKNKCPPCEPYPAKIKFNKTTHYTHDHGKCLEKIGSITH